MTIPSASQLAFVMSDIESRAAAAKSQAQAALARLAGSNVDSLFAFSVIDQMNGFIGFLQSRVGTAGLDAYATANVPGYTGTLTTDINATIAAAQQCISWIVNAFPKDSTNTWILAFTFNGDGTRNSRQFSPTDTAGLQSRLQTFINSIA